MRIEILRSAWEAGQAVTLRKRGGELEVLLGNVLLLSSAALGTERAFGRLAERRPAHVVGEGADRVLVGGLGFGATLRGVLEVVAPPTEVIVVERLLTIVDIVRNEAAALSGGSLDDPRVQLVSEDVGDVLAQEKGLSAILLDVDNGPEWASFRSNGRLYAAEGLVRAYGALRAGGIFAVWSGYPRDAFVHTLRSAGFAPEIVLLAENGTTRARAYLGSKPASSPRGPWQGG